MTHRLTVVIVAIALVNEISSENTTDIQNGGVKENKTAAAAYSFRYYINDESTGDFKTQEETRQGDSVRGSYSVAEPNGDLRTVTYTAGDGKGFQATVDVKKKINTPRGLNTEKEMMAPKRRPKPKKPMGNDIGVARVLESDVKVTPEGYTMNISSKPSEDLKTTVIVDFSNNSTSDPVEKEITEVLSSMPELPELDIETDNSSSHLEFHKNPEEASLDERITQVARQLAETSLRREFEEKKLGHNFPITLQETNENSDRKPVGKSFESPANALPLVNRFPPETAQLQLITEVQSVPQNIYKEGFFPMTPAPELSGPLLGGPPLKKKTSTTTEEPDNNNLSESQKNNQSEAKDVKPEGKNLKIEQDVPYFPQIKTIPIRVPAYLRFMMPGQDFIGTEQQEREYTVFLNIAPYPIKYNRNFIYNNEYFSQSKLEEGK